MVSKLNKLPKEWEKIFGSYTPDKELITRIYRELKKLNSLKINNPMTKLANELDRGFSKEEIQMSKKNEEIFNMPDDKGNAYQNLIKILLHSS
jgi:hypothetical protein